MTTVSTTVFFGLCVEGRKGITDIVTKIGEKVLARLLQTVHGIRLSTSRTIIGWPAGSPIRLSDMCQHQADQLLLLCRIRYIIYLQSITKTMTMTHPGSPQWKCVSIANRILNLLASVSINSP